MTGCSGHRGENELWRGLTSRDRVRMEERERDRFDFSLFYLLNTQRQSQSTLSFLSLTLTLFYSLLSLLATNQDIPNTTREFPQWREMT